MYRLLILFLLGWTVNASAADIPTDSVLLRGLDKTTGRVKTFEAKVGKATSFGELTIVVDKCLKRPVDEAPENTAFLTVEETETGNSVFQGWMFSSNPALSAMEHPVYDVWVLECEDSASKIAPIQTVASNITTETLDEQTLAEIDD
ncbi:MAG: DUF2155 domain-containing protein [Alphaproteobacteria bacterium]|nr:DUF2155 domain-containing protein [Alphaproteobacteria bacterium]